MTWVRAAGFRPTVWSFGVFTRLMVTGGLTSAGCDKPLQGFLKS